MLEDIRKILDEYKDDTKRHFDVKMNEIINLIDYCLLKIALIKIRGLEKRVSMMEIKFNKIS